MLWMEIIPMRVGTRNQFLNIFRYFQDHPHACGDKCSLPLNNRLCSGSSPCVWGQVLSLPLCNGQGRIIPMRVGTSSVNRLNRRLSKDHPHACGDKFQNVLQALRLLGSSPCVWGQVKNNLAISPLSRIIPMRVGTSKQSPITSNGG